MSASYLTPKEIFSKHPELKNKHQLSERTLSFLLRNKLLNGYYNRNKRVTLICETSLIQFMNYLNMALLETSNNH